MQCVGGGHSVGGGGHFVGNGAHSVAGVQSVWIGGHCVGSCAIVGQMIPRLGHTAGTNVGPVTASACGIPGGHCGGAGQIVCGHAVSGSVGNFTSPGHGAQIVGSGGHFVGCGGQAVACGGQRVGSAGHCVGCGQTVCGQVVSGKVGKPICGAGAAATAAGGLQTVAGAQIVSIGHCVNGYVGPWPPPSCSHGGHCVCCGQSVRGHSVAGSVGNASHGAQAVGMGGHSVSCGGQTVAWGGQRVGTGGHCVGSGQTVAGHAVSGSVGNAAAAFAAFSAPPSGCGQIGGISGQTVGRTGQSVAIGGWSVGSDGSLFSPPVEEGSSSRSPCAIGDLLSIAGRHEKLAQRGHAARRRPGPYG